MTATYSHRNLLLLALVFLAAGVVAREVYIDSEENKHVPLEVCLSSPVQVGKYAWVEGMGQLIVTEIENSTRCGPGVTAALAVRAVFAPPAAK